MSVSCSPIRAPRALEPKDSPRSQRTLQFIPASHMPKRQANSLPFQDSILHIHQTNTHATSSSPNPSQLTLRDVCDPMRRNIVNELEHPTRLPDVYEEEDAIWTMGRDTAKLPGIPYLTSRHSKVKPRQGSPSTTDHNLELSPPIRQRVAEYRRRNVVKKLRTPFSYEHGVWDDPPLDFEAVAQVQKRGSALSKRERAGSLISGLLGRKEARDRRNRYRERGHEREASVDSHFVNDDVGSPIPHSSTIARSRSRSLEKRQQAIKLVGTIRRRKMSLEPGQLSAGQYEESPLASLEPKTYNHHTPLCSDNSKLSPRGASPKLIERRDNYPDRIAQTGEHARVLSPSDRNWATPGPHHSPEVTGGDSGSLVSESDTNDSRSAQRRHRQQTTLDIVVESEEGQIILKESYHIPCGPPVFTGSGVTYSPPAKAVTNPVDRVHFSRFHGDDGPGGATAKKTSHTLVAAVPIPQTSSEARIQPPIPPAPVTDMAENDTLTWSHTSPNVSSVTLETTRSHSIAHKHPLPAGEYFAERVEAVDCHQDHDGDCATDPELDWFKMGAYLRVPDRAAASDEYHRIKLQRIEQLRNTPNRHRNPAYAKFKTEYRLRKQEERNEERRIRSLAKQNAEAAMFFQALETGSDLERRRVTSDSRHSSRVYRRPSTV